MDTELQIILQQCAISTRVTAQTFFPERFYMPFAEEVHGKIFDLIDGPDQKVAIAAPRGYGKTSIVALALITLLPAGQFRPSLWPSLSHKSQVFWPRPRSNQ